MTTSVFLALGALLTTPLSTARAETTSSKAVVCQMEAPGFKAEVSVFANMTSTMLIADKATGIRHSCPLVIENVTDGRRAVSSTVVFHLVRQGACTPALVEPMRSTLNHSIPVSLNFNDRRSPKGTSYLIESKDHYDCKRLTLRTVDFDHILNRVQSQGGIPMRAYEPEDHASKRKASTGRRR